MQVPDKFTAPPRLLMGPGPSEVAPSVLQAMAQPLVGHLDPVFVKMMEEIKTMLRAVFQTQNEMTFPVSGTGSAGLEFCCVNLIEPGDEVVVGVNGVFGNRLAEVAERCGARVTKVEAEWGRIIEADKIKEALAKVAQPKLVALVHAVLLLGHGVCCDIPTPIDPNLTISVMIAEVHNSTIGVGRHRRL